MHFEFATANRIIFGSGTLKEVPPLAVHMGSKALVITGSTSERGADLIEQLPWRACHHLPGSL